jgi:hypothetical protein
MCFLLALFLVLSLTLVEASKVVLDGRLNIFLVNVSACFLWLLALRLWLASEVIVVLTFTALGLGLGLLLDFVDSLLLLDAARILFLVASLFLVLTRAFLIILGRRIVIIISAITVLLTLLLVLLLNLLLDSGFGLDPLVFVFRFEPARIAVCEHIFDQDLNSQRDAVFRILSIKGLQFAESIVNFFQTGLKFVTFVIFLSLTDAAIQSYAQLGYKSDSSLTRVVINT